MDVPPPTGPLTAPATGAPEGASGSVEQERRAATPPGPPRGTVGPTQPGPPPANGGADDQEQPAQPAPAPGPPAQADSRATAPNPGNLPRRHKPAAPPERPGATLAPGGPAPLRPRTPATAEGVIVPVRNGKRIRYNSLRARRLPKFEETSAGGVVLDLSSSPARVALIARHDRRSRLLWSLPKGHVEEGETPSQAALREVHEETGLIGRVVAPLGVIDFWFVVEDKRIHKTVHHFVIEAVGGDLSDEDIEVEAVEWVPFDQVVRRLAYGDERRLVEKVADIVPGVK